ncbi:COX15/CtaA family protein [Granulicella sp. dw_53]|uniref:COX15/CtaA family protein n=1 Tax=Granulicella sp. dw_53 TaxID=2719792 RepID=UPI001BD62186|nr:COX15/CtaA family protein [Granulicella sp. dw_53]
MTTISIPVQSKTPTRALVAFAWFALSFMVLVVLWGAVVRATSSGAGCGANWPLCNGDFFPHHPRLATVIEFTHRSMSGICTFLVVALLVWTFYGTERGHRARKAAVWSAALLVMEAFLGAMLVLRHYVENNISTGRIVMQSIHFTNTMLLLAALGLTAWFLGRAPERRTREQAAEGAKSIAVLAIIATIVVGATGSLAALADTLFPSPSLQAALAADFAASSPLLVRMRWVHPAASLIGLVCVLLLARKVKTRLSRFVLMMVLAQIVLGVGDVLLLAPTWMQVVHLLGADIYWIALVGFAGEALWPENFGSRETLSHFLAQNEGPAASSKSRCRPV